MTKDAANTPLNELAEGRTVAAIRLDELDNVYVAGNPELTHRNVSLRIKELLDMLTILRSTN